MEKNGPYFIVGVFVLAGIMGIISFALWLGGSVDTRHYKHYTVYFTDPVNGLKDGASVQYRGVDVGKVTHVGLARDRRDLIRAEIEIHPSVPVGAETEAKLEVLGITGLVYISLSTSPDDTNEPQRIEGEKHPVIHGSGTQLAKILQDIPTISKQILEITTKMNKLLSEENVGKLNATMANLESLTKDFNGMLSENNVAAAGSAIKNIDTAMTDFSETSRKTGELVDRLEKTADSIDEAVNTLNKMVTANETHINRFTSQGLNEITQTAKAARKMVESIRGVAQELDGDPSRLVYPAAEGTTTISP